MQRVWRTVTGFYHVCARGMGKQLIFEAMKTGGSFWS